MVKANELRIGNWVRYKEYSNIKVESVGQHGINLVCGDGGMYWDSYEDLSPIPLTPEILEKAGFQGWKRQVNMNMGYEGGDIFFGIPDGFDTFRDGTFKQPKYKHSFILDLVLGKKINDEDYEFTIYYGRGGSKKGIEISSVHQLQNLYHALTGTELEINL